MHCIACAADCWLPAVNQLLKVNPSSIEFHLNIFSELVIDMHCTWSSFEYIQHSYHWPRIRSLSMPTTLSLRRNADDDDDEHSFIHIEIAIGLYIFFFLLSQQRLSLYWKLWIEADYKCFKTMVKRKSKCIRASTQLLFPLMIFIWRASMFKCVSVYYFDSCVCLQFRQYVAFFIFS